MRRFINPTYITVLVATAVIALLHYGGVLRYVENAARRVVQPMQEVGVGVGTELTLTYDRTTDRRDLYEINQQLEAAYKAALTENARLKSLVEENDDLRQQLGFYTRHSYSRVLANITSRGTASTDHVFVIDRGSRDGITVGQAAITGDGVVVGTVFEVRDGIAFVRMITDVQSQVAAAIAGKETAQGILKGNLGLTAQLDFIPQDSDIAVDDTVVTSGLDIHIPKGLLIGSIKDIHVDDNDLFKQAVVEPLFNVHALRIVSIITL